MTHIAEPFANTADGRIFLETKNPAPSFDGTGRRVYKSGGSAALTQSRTKASERAFSAVADNGDTHRKEFGYGKRKRLKFRYDETQQSCRIGSYDFDFDSLMMVGSALRKSATRIMPMMIMRFHICPL